MISGYISLNTVVAKIYRTLGVNYEINFGDCIEWAAEALNLIGAFSQYDSISDCLEFSCSKVKLPCNFHKLVDITYNGHPLNWSSNSVATNYGCSDCQIPVCNNSCDYTFYINDSYIITNIENPNKGLCIIYLGMPVDDEGYPLIPSDVYYQKAIESFIISMLDYQDWRKGKLPDKVYQKSEADWLFYVNSARGSANMPNTAMMENFKNILQRLMPLNSEYNKGFKNFTKRERLNIK